MALPHTRTLSRLFLPSLFGAALIILCAGRARAHPAWGIVVTSHGTVYFSDLETIWKIDRQGRLAVARTGENGRHMHELWIDSQDNIYGPELSYVPETQTYITAVWKMAPDGRVTYLKEPSNRPQPGTSIWIDRAGNMYSVDQNNHTKVRTLLLRRSPAGVVTTLAGSRYGHADGKGTAAQFSSVDAITFGPDGNLYLTDGAYVRRVSMDGNVVTVAKDLTARTAEDKPTLFETPGDNLAGLAVDPKGNVYVADAGNRRLLRIMSEGKVTVVYRVDPPYFPTGVFATKTGEVYVLEFSFIPPGTTGSPRVREISADGSMRLLGGGIGYIVPLREGPRTPLLTFTRWLASYRWVVLAVALLTTSSVVILWAWYSRRRRRGI
jgi:streptogramin lyase